MQLLLIETEISIYMFWSLMPVFRRFNAVNYLQSSLFYLDIIQALHIHHFLYEKFLQGFFVVREYQHTYFSLVERDSELEQSVTGETSTNISVIKEHLKHAIAVALRSLTLLYPTKKCLQTIVVLQKMTHSFHLRISSSFQQVCLQFMVVKVDAEIDVSVRLQDKCVFHTITKVTRQMRKQIMTFIKMYCYPMWRYDIILQFYSIV